MAAAALLGALLASGQAPLGWAWLAFPALIGLMALGATARGTRHAAWLGWLAGTGYFAAALNWIVEPFLIEPELYGWLAPFGLIGLAGGLALFWALAFWAARRLGGGALRLALALSLAELARGYLLTGFPWALLGYIWTETVLAQLAAWIGPYGLTALTLGMAALPVWLWRRGGLAPPMRRAGQALGVTVGIGAVLWYTAVTRAAQPLPEVAEAPVLRLIQPNAPQHQKWDPEMIPVFFNRMVTYSAQGPAPDLILWPESAVPVLLEDAAETLAYISDQARGVPMLLGIQRSEGRDFYNSAAFVDDTGQVGQVYDKFHLVPFGEYMPFPALWQGLGIHGLASRVDTGYSAGPGPQVMDLGFARALPLICYEAVFPQYVRQDDRPDLLVQLTNDAWFGANTGPYQHLAQARMRAIESGLPMVRVANTGVSAVIDARGRVTAALPLNQAGYLDAALPAALAPTLYSRTGDLPLWVLLILSALAAIAGDRRKGD
ncbi:MAG: apolipoprotein N-acyltransferase [Rhodobacteraceae bacterium]|nr:MAG: apolipoprotein N-acyltransferase [Paracoccaceae bacterium]